MKIRVNKEKIVFSASNLSSFQKIISHIQYSFFSFQPPSSFQKIISHIQCRIRFSRNNYGSSIYQIGLTTCSTSCFVFYFIFLDMIIQII
jgi:hypothetical protein